MLEELAGASEKRRPVTKKQLEAGEKECATLGKRNGGRCKEKTDPRKTSGSRWKGGNAGVSIHCPHPTFSIIAEKADSLLDQGKIGINHAS
jgi:hypothetical protein